MTGESVYDRSRRSVRCPGCGREFVIPARRRGGSRRRRYCSNACRQAAYRARRAGRAAGRGVDVTTT